MARIDVSSLGSYIREQRTNAELSIRELARVTGVSNPYLSQIERGIRQPSAQTLSRVADALRISAEQLYVRAGFLDKPQGATVKGAIMDDPYLTDLQREELLSLYEKFIGGNGLSTLKAPHKATKTAAAKKTTAKKTTATKTTRTSSTKKTSARTSTKGQDR